VSDVNHRPNPDALDRATGALRDAPTPPGPPAGLAAGTLEAINNRLAGAVPAEQVRRQRRRRIMRYASFGTAVAAAVAIGVVLWSPGRTTAGMFDRAMENAGKASTMRAKITTTAAGMKFEMKMYGKDDRFRTEMDMGKDLGAFVIIVDGTQKKGLQLTTPAKTAKWLDLSKLDEKEKAAEKDAAGLAHLFADLKGKEVKNLPDETVDGRKLKVFTVKGHKMPGSKGEADVTVWIDPKTELPVKCQMELTAGEVKALAVMEILGWNEDLDDALFELKIPAGYREEKE
jgi:outer membrane lipoprotein-sorting protein